FTILEHSQIIFGLPSGLQQNFRRQCRPPGQACAAQMVLKEEPFQPAEKLAVDQVGGVELAATKQQMNGVIVIVPGNGLVGARKLAERDLLEGGPKLPDCGPVRSLFLASGSPILGLCLLFLVPRFSILGSQLRMIQLRWLPARESVQIGEDFKGRLVA